MHWTSIYGPYYCLTGASWGLWYSLPWKGRYIHSHCCLFYRGDVKYSTSQQYASTTSHVARMILREDWRTICRMMDAHFGVLSCSQWGHRWGRVGKCMEKGHPQQAPSRRCGHPNSSNRVLEERGPCSNLCSSPQCSCVQGNITTPFCTTLRMETPLCMLAQAEDTPVQSGTEKWTTRPSTGGKWNRRKVSHKGHSLPPTHKRR